MSDTTAIYQRAFRTVCAINFPRLTFEQFCTDVAQRMAETGRSETYMNVKKCALEIARNGRPKGYTETARLGCA